MRENTVTVYRVENYKGLGPYRGMKRSEATQWQSCTHSWATGRPCPLDDFDCDYWNLPPWDRLNYKFGFLYLEDLKEWFTDDELLALRRLGYHIREYLVLEDCVLLAEESGQIAFNSTQARKEGSWGE